METTYIFNGPQFRKCEQLDIPLSAACIESYQKNTLQLRLNRTIQLFTEIEKLHKFRICKTMKCPAVPYGCETWN